MEALELERRLAAIFAADVAGYSRLMHRDEETTMALLSARRATIDDLTVGHRGRIANTAGDSVLAEFASALDAVSCAAAIQQAMDAADAAEPQLPMRKDTQTDSELTAFSNSTRRVILHRWRGRVSATPSWFRPAWRRRTRPANRRSDLHSGRGPGYGRPRAARSLPCEIPRRRVNDPCPRPP